MSDAASPKPPIDDADARAVEEARARVRRERELASEGGVFGRAQRVWSDFRQHVKDRNEDLAADLAEGQRKLAQQRASAAAAGGQNGAAASETRSFLPELDGSTAPRRALAGFNHVFPLLGMAAAYSTFELMQRERVRFSADVLTRGCLKGTMRWLPFGIGAGMFYGMEYTLRPIQAELLPGGVKLPYFGRVMYTPSIDGVYDNANIVSKAAAGLTAGIVVSVPLHLLGWQGVRTWAGVTGLSMAAAVGGVLMPEYEEFDRAMW